MAAAVSDGIDFSLVRDASRGYLDPAKFPNVWEGGALDIWKTQNNQQSVNMFTVKELYPVTDEDVKELLSDVFMVIVPEQNIEGYEHMTRTTGQGYDPNRDEANQTLFEDSNAMALVNKFNPMVFTEIHGRVDAMLIEPCTPPHEPNFEYDLIAEQFVKLGEAVGMGAIANNSEHNSFEMPYRDFLKKSSTSPSGAEWSSPWDDMTTAYGSQFPVLIGTAGITWELPVYSDVTAERVVPYGLMTQAMFIRDNKISMLTNQAKLFERGVNNTNSNADVAYEGVAVPSTPDTPETPDTPDPAKSATGDTMNVTLWVVVAIASCAAIPAVVVVCRRRTSR